MKTFSKLLLLISLFLSVNTIAQEIDEKRLYFVERDSAYYAKYEKLKELYIKKIHSPTYRKYKSLINSYKSKWRFAYEGSGDKLGAELAKNPGGLNWIKNNLEKTKFESYEAAVEEFDLVMAAAKDDNTANKEFSEYSLEVMMNSGPGMYIDLVEEMMMLYPDMY